MNHVAAAPALTALNAMPRTDATAAAFAYLSGEYPDMRDLFKEVAMFIGETGGAITHEDAAGAADWLSKGVETFVSECDTDRAPCQMTREHEVLEGVA